jgi:hypothetical protein
MQFCCAGVVPIDLNSATFSINLLPTFCSREKKYTQYFFGIYISTNHLTSVYWKLFFITLTVSLSKATSSAQTRNRCVPFSLSPVWLIYHNYKAQFKIMLKTILNRTVSDQCLPTETLLQVSFKHTSINLISYIGIKNLVRILFKTSIRTEFIGFLDVYK